MKTIQIFILMMALILSVGCKRQEVEPTPPVLIDRVIEIESFLSDVELTSDERAYLEVLKKNGKLSVATRELDSVYEIDENGVVSGFNYLLLERFAKEVDVELDLKFVGFSDYFKIHGNVPEEVKTNPDFSYTPDLFNEVDIYCDVISVLPWREKLFKFIDIVPVKQMTLTRKGEELNSLDELTEKVIALKPDTSYESRLWEIEKELDVKFDYYYVEGTRDQQKAVSEGFADVSIQDSNIAMNELKQYDNLSVSIPVADVQKQGWGVLHENIELASILEKYIRYAKETGVMDELWNDEYGITLLEYLKLID